MADVVVVGSYNAALTIYSHRLPLRGETVVGTRFDDGPGGKGANQAIGAKRLGADVLFVTSVGSDTFGEAARATLAREGLPPRGIITSDAPTGIALILVDAAGENIISVAPGANLSLSAERVLHDFRSELERARFLVLQLECSAELATDLGGWAREHGIFTILNPAPARAIPVDHLASFDLLTPNETELAELARALGASTTDPEAGAKALLAYGVKHVVVTLAEDGALWMSSTGTERFAAYDARAIDATGAGDAFNAGLVAALADGKTIDAAIDYGCRAGAYCVTRSGVIDGLPRREDLLATAHKL